VKFGPDKALHCSNSKALHPPPSNAVRAIRHQVLQSKPEVPDVRQAIVKGTIVRISAVDQAFIWHRS